MRLRKEGDRSVAVCPNCVKQVTTHFAYRDFPLEEPAVVVPNVLVGVCDVCGATASVPHQSTPKIREVRRKAEKSLEVRVPEHLLDAVGLIADSLHVPARAMLPLLVRFYLLEVSRDRELVRALVAASRSSVASGRRKGRVSIRMRADIVDKALKAGKSAGLEGISDLTRAAVVMAAIDHGFTQPDVPFAPSPDRRKRVEDVAFTAG